MRVAPSAYQKSILLPASATLHFQPIQEGTTSPSQRAGIHTVMPRPAAFTAIADNLSYLDDWEDRYRYIIELGQALPPLAASEKNSATKVNGCVSQVWLISERVGNLLQYRGESDALIVRGLAAILISLYSGRTAKEIADTDAIAVFDELGLREHISTQRSNGLVAMVNRIRSEARALAA
jgi:cysteine desulfuration protein SufE